MEQHHKIPEILFLGSAISDETADEILAKSSGYTLTSPDEEIASYGGFKDWFISEFARHGFTVEIGRGKNPLPISQLNSIYEKIEEMLMIFTVI